jgi:hypothetical protein
MTKFEYKKQQYFSNNVDKNTKFFIISNYLDEILDLSSFINIHGIKCGDSMNKTKIRKIILSKNCPYLTSIICNSIQLEEIILPEYSPNLDIIVLHSNQLRKLEIPDCSMLENLDCHNNLLTCLNLKDFCPKLKTLIVSKNFLSTISFPTFCPNLQYVYCNLNSINNTIDLSVHTNLKEFYCSYNTEELMITGLPENIEHIDCSHTDVLCCILTEKMKLTINDKLIIESKEMEELYWEKKEIYGNREHNGGMTISMDTVEL